MIEYDFESLSNELQKMALGACFLGSGGGGEFKTSSMFIENYLKYCSEDEKNHKLRIADLDDVEAGQGRSGIVVAYMGAPQKLDKVKCPDAICEVINNFWKDKRIDYIIPIEIGAVSSIAACLTAHKLNKPVLNLDGAGRAVPTLDLITYTTNAGASVNPTILCSEKTDKDPVYHQVKLEISEDTDPGAASKMESLARPVLNMPEFDQKAGLVMWYFEDVTKLFKVDHDTYPSVPGTLTFCQKLGGAIQSMQGENWEFSKIEELFKSQSQSIYPAIKENYPAIKEMCRGKLISATTSTAGGFDVGVITIEDEGDSARHYTIIFQNESLILWDSNYADPLAMAPDLISYSIKDKQKQYVFTNGDIMLNGKLNEDLEGTEIIVYGIAAPRALMESESNMIKHKKKLCNTIAGVKPNALPKHYMSILNNIGYYGRYVPLEK